MDDSLKERLGNEPEVGFPVIGIGASAGGLEAVTEMFNKIESDTGMAYVLVLHLDPNHESLMAELLSRKTAIDVRQIKDGDKIEIDCLHVIPPGFSLRIKRGVFRLEKFDEPRGLRRPIDSFLVSLAETQGEQAAGVVVSGTGADGSAGLKIIKEFGGICAVQSPSEARYDGMPFSALATNMVDFELPAVQIIPRLKQFFDGTHSPRILDDAERHEGSLQEIFAILRAQFGHDFSGYKRSTLVRRLERRMQVLEITEAERYIELLKENHQEAFALLEDFLINVTAFFRDPQHFETLRAEVLEPSIRDLENGGELRIWVPGCSSGQEAYTLAMLVAETCRKYDRRILVQIFATDVDAKMIEIARKGRYPASSFTELPKMYQDTYTIGLDGKFEVIKAIRDMVRFSTHNVLQDAPYSKIDLISCRNFIIYLGDALQSELLPLLHFSLRPGGFLFLGTSENVTRREELFEPIDQRARIFKRRDSVKRGPLNILRPGLAVKHGVGQTSAKMLPDVDFPRHRSLDAGNSAIYEQYAPPFVRVASDGRIIDSSGDLSLFIMARPNEERTINNLARAPVRDVVVPLISGAIREERRMALKGVEVTSPYGMQRADIVAHPLKDDTVAVIFIVKDRFQPAIDEYSVEPRPRDRRIADLQEELQGTQLVLKSKVEEIETANEELKSSNEEMMSMNEELQSANEELTTANEELKNKIDELVVANADLDNFMRSADLAMVVLDRSLRIRHVTEATANVLPISQQDRGRQIGEFNIGFANVDLHGLLHLVLKTGEASVVSAETADRGHSFFIRVSPYHLSEGVVEGVTLTMTDITEEMALRNQLAYESEMLRLALKAGRMGVAVANLDTNAFDIDAMTSDIFSLEAGEQSTDALFDLMMPEDAEAVRNELQRALVPNTEISVEFRLPQEDGQYRWVKADGFSHKHGGDDTKINLVSRDVSVARTEAENRELLISEMSHRVKNLFAVISSLIQSAPKLNNETEAFAEELVGRVSALGDGYDLARRNRWLEGTSFKDLIKKMLEPHLAGQEVTLDGPMVEVGPDHLSTLSLILHELTTNALKYGALSRPDGKLSVAWATKEDGRTIIHWREHCDPIKAVGKDGFGTKLTDTGARQLRGSVEREFLKDGLSAKLTFRMSKESDGA